MEFTRPMLRTRYIVLKLILPFILFVKHYHWK